MENDIQVETKTKNKWWQMLLLYPALAIAILGAIPTYVELYQSQKKNVAFGESAKAKMRNNMWRKNLTCSTAPLDPLITEHNIEVDATICKSGDVLIRVMAPGNKKFFEWFAVDHIFSINTASVSLFSQAIAEEITLGEEAKEIDFEVEGILDSSFQVAQYGPVILCQRWLDRVMLLRRVSYPNGVCFDETVNTYTGFVVNSVRSPCNC